MTVRLRGGEGQLLGEQKIPSSFGQGGRYLLKIEMEGERGVPRFSLTPMRGR